MTCNSCVAQITNSTKKIGNPGIYSPDGSMTTFDELFSFPKTDCLSKEERIHKLRQFIISALSEENPTKKFNLLIDKIDSMLKEAYISQDDADNHRNFDHLNEMGGEVYFVLRYMVMKNNVLKNRKLSSPNLDRFQDRIDYKDLKFTKIMMSNLTFYAANRYQQEGIEKTKELSVFYRVTDPYNKLKLIGNRIKKRQ